MREIEFPGKMDALLGKISLAYVAEIYLDWEDLRVLSTSDIVAGSRLPAIVYNASPELDKELWAHLMRLLDRGEIGLIVSADDVKYLRSEGREVDYIILYGSEEFWSRAASIPEVYGLSRSRFLALVEAFGRHLAAMRLFFDAFHNIPIYVRYYLEGTISRERLAQQLVDAILDVSAYAAYSTRTELMRKVIDVMQASNAAALESVKDPATLLELEEPPRINIRLKLDDVSEAERIYDAVKLLHPRAVEKVSDNTVAVKYLF